MATSASTNRVDALARSISEMAAPRLFPVLAKNVGEAFLTEARLGFERSVTPDDKPWAALKHRQGLPLLRTGRLRGSFTWQLDGNRLKLGTNVGYAKFHQFGTRGRSSASRMTRAVGKNGRFLTRKQMANANKRAALATRDVHERAQHYAARSGLLDAETAYAIGLKLAMKEQRANERGSVVGFRTLNFKAGSGGIPARPMLPTGSTLPPRWREAFETTALSVRNQLLGR